MNVTVSLMCIDPTSGLLVRHIKVGIQLNTESRVNLLSNNASIHSNQWAYDTNNARICTPTCPHFRVKKRRGDVGQAGLACGPPTASQLPQITLTCSLTAVRHCLTLFHGARIATHLKYNLLYCCVTFLYTIYSVIQSGMGDDA